MTAELADTTSNGERAMPDNEMPDNEMRDDETRDDETPDAVPVPHALVPHLSETAILLDIDGTLLELMPTPREVWVPSGLSDTLNRLVELTSGAVSYTHLRAHET